MSDDQRKPEQRGIFDGTPDDPKIRRPEREYAARFDKDRRYVPVEYDWITPTLGNFA